MTSNSEKIIMYNPCKKVVIQSIDPRYESRWKTLGFLKLNQQAIRFFNQSTLAC